MSQPAQLPAIIETQGNLEIRPVCDPMQEKLIYWAGELQETTENKMLIVRCLQGQDYKSEDVYGQEIMIEKVITHPVTITDKETGEIVMGVRTVLVDPEGARYSFTSSGVFKSIKQLVFAWGMPPWKPAKKVKLIVTKPGGVKQFFQLEPIGA